MERPRVPTGSAERVAAGPGRPAGSPSLSGVVVLCCGLTTLDVIQEVDAVPAPNEKAVARALTVTFGGPAANAAATAVALGARARLVTSIGSGPVADLVRAELATAGVEVVDLAAGSGAAPAVSTVLVTASTGQRAVVSVNATRSGELPTVPAGVLDGVGVVLVDGHHLASALEVARSARAVGVPVVHDGGSWKPGLERLLALVDHAIVSADFRVPAGELPADGSAADGSAADGSAADGSAADGSATDGAAIDGAETGRASARVDPRERILREVASFGPLVVARSDGAGPLLVLEPRASAAVRSVTVPVDPARRVVDTVGAGDVLHGAYAAFLGGTCGAVDPVVLLARAAGVASESVHFAGARGWVPGYRG